MGKGNKDSIYSDIKKKVPGVGAYNLKTTQSTEIDNHSFITKSKRHN